MSDDTKTTPKKPPRKRCKKLPLSHGHVQSKMAAEVPRVASVLRKYTEGRPGQPTKRTDELIERMQNRMMRGDSLLIICQDDDMPGYSTVMRWKAEDKKLWSLFSEAEEDMARAIDDMNELIVRGIITTGEYRRDELWVSVNNQRKRHLNRKRYDDRQTVDMNSTISITMAPFNALPAPDTQVIEGEVLDPDAVHERSTVERIMSEKPGQDSSPE